MGHIVALDQNMINMIAAGEVIERPASVVKELTENSIDAGATRIDIAIEDGGRKLISITDDGCGMDGEDLALAFESHATSKIKTSTDLRSISTLGFRGEALASIASVAQVKAVSRTKDNPAGNCVEIDCGQKTPLQPCSADCGTTIQVRDIFYKLPARRKFLKTANTEISHISEQFTRIALAKNHLDMSLQHNGKELYRLTKNQSLRRRIGELFSNQISENLIEAQSSERNLEIFALLGTPEISRTNNKYQYVFLNGRFIRDKFISHAIKQAYRGILEPDRFAVVFLFIKIPFEDVDINVHPTKTEVRFYNSNLVHSQILGCLREKLLEGRFQQSGTIPSKAPLSEQSQRQRIAKAMAEFFERHQTVQNQPRFSFNTGQTKTSTPKTAEQTTDYQTNTIPPSNRFLQIRDSFIVAESEDGFIVVDQHALHERILYEKLRQRTHKTGLQSQKLLVPESFEVTELQVAALENHHELLDKLGIELIPFGPKTYACQGFPTMLAKASPADFVGDLLDLLVEKADCDQPQGLFEDVLHMAACKGAIKAGQKLTDTEIEQLLVDKDVVEYSGRCPHGRPTVIKFTIDQLEKQFKRT